MNIGEILFWIFILLIGWFLANPDVKPHTGNRPPEHPPGWKNTQRNKRRTS